MPSFKNFAGGGCPQTPTLKHMQWPYHFKIAASSPVLVSVYKHLNIGGGYVSFAHQTVPNSWFVEWATLPTIKLCMIMTSMDLLSAVNKTWAKVNDTKCFCLSHAPVAQVWLYSWKQFWSTAWALSASSIDCFSTKLLLFSLTNRSMITLCFTR